MVCRAVIEGQEFWTYFGVLEDTLGLLGMLDVSSSLHVLHRGRLVDRYGSHAQLGQRGAYYTLAHNFRRDGVSEGWSRLVIFATRVMLDRASRRKKAKKAESAVSVGRTSVYRIGEATVSLDFLE